MSFFSSILETPTVSRVRRNHGLEHATLTLLAPKYPHVPLAGHSDTGGFWILGAASTEDIRAAAEQALARMRAGEHILAVHPNCGTNLVTAGVMAGAAAWLGMVGSRRGQDQWDRLPVSIMLATLALLLAQPIGPRLQASVTTSGDPGDLEISAIRMEERGGIQAHRIETRG